MNFFLLLISLSFWGLLLYHSVLIVFGVWYRMQIKEKKELEEYPSVALLIPAHNEGVVLGDTLYAMSKLIYPGKLDIYILNDNSIDDTKSIAEDYARLFPHMHAIDVPDGNPKGKSRVLNYGISISSSDYIAVYDADNHPEPNALTLLVEASETTKDAVGAVGYVKTRNETQNVLTRMIALEFSSFQLAMQAGRWKLFGLGSLTGTNMLVRRDALSKVGGYDPYALAEDADLTLSLTAIGGKLPIVPEARTWEQEPETLGVFVKQRTRWMQGNLYLIEKSLKEPKKYFKGRNMVHSLQQMGIYLAFVFLLLVSDVWFVLGLFGKVETVSFVPLLVLWVESWLIYFVQLMTSQWMDKKITMKDLLISFLMYFTYSQLWIYIYLKAFLAQWRLKKNKQQPMWEKTKRFQERA